MNRTDSAPSAERTSTTCLTWPETWNAGINAAAEHARRNPPTRAELAKTRAEFEELAAGAAPEFREILERMAAQYRDLEAKARE